MNAKPSADAYARDAWPAGFTLLAALAIHVVGWASVLFLGGMDPMTAIACLGTGILGSLISTIMAIANLIHHGRRAGRIAILVASLMSSIAMSSMLPLLFAVLAHC